jgi:hypothetical protein
VRVPESVEKGPMPVELSVAATVKSNVPVAVGVPLRVRLRAGLRPGGGDPDDSA